MSTNPHPETAPSPDAPARRARHARLTWLIALAVGVLAVDQVSKAWALSALEEGVRHPVLGDLLGIQLLFNPGAALGLATGTTWLLTLIALVVVVVIVRVARRLGSMGWAIALGLLLGGAVGNLIDRLVREPGVGRGHVIDFIAYGNWFVGNVADIAIVVAAGLLMILSFRGVALDGTREGAAAASSDGEAAGPTETAGPSETAEPTEAAGPGGTVEPVDLPEPVATAEPAELTEPAEVAEPAEPVRPADVARPVTDDSLPTRGDRADG